MDQKQFDVAVALVKSTGEKMDGMLHECALFAITQLNEHGNNGAANRLLGALNKSTRKEALYVWFNAFGMCKRNNKDNTLDYSSKKKLSYDGSPITAQETLILADENPFFDYTKEPKPALSYDVQQAIKSILSRVNAMQNKGKVIEHSDLLEKLRELVPAK